MPSIAGLIGFGDERILVVLNLGGEPTSASFPGGHLRGHILISSMDDRDGEPVLDGIDLRPNEGVVVDAKHGFAIAPGPGEEETGAAPR